ncbi:hypothetical protein LCGC14_1253890 [marine sediment metagenome]|uniref:Uncharacterized protein n=1 Tax=marine sediment metagenome TaxID=412755 RepID=A0A0F9NJB1_9ZZZZ
MRDIQIDGGPWGQPSMPSHVDAGGWNKRNNNRGGTHEG